MICREKQAQQKRRRDAFTLMEMLVVVAIIVALAGMGGFYFMGQLERARKDNARVQCKVLTDAAELYEMRHGANTCTGAQMLTQPEADGQPGILKKDAPVIDPWGHPYELQRENGQIYFQSQGGSDGKPIRNGGAPGQ